MSVSGPTVPEPARQSTRRQPRQRVGEPPRPGRLAGVSADDVTAIVEQALDPYVESGHLPGYVAGVNIDGETAMLRGGKPARARLRKIR